MRLRGIDSEAIVFPGPNRVELVAQRLPRPRRDEALLTARCSLISTGTERRCLTHDFAPGTHWDEWVRYPFRPGYSLVGVADDGSRACAEVPHARHAVVARENLIPIPDAVGDEQASWFALAAIAQHGFARSGLGAGETAVVIGAGVLGQLVAQLARLAGADVIILARSRPRLEVAATHGAAHVVVADAAAARDQVLALTQGEGAAVVFEVTGNGPVFADALKLARRGGTVVLLGDAGDPSEQRLGPELLVADLSVIGAHIANVDIGARRRMAAEFFAAVTDGGLVVEDLITSRVRPADAPALYASLGENDPGRLGILIDWA